MSMWSGLTSGLNTAWNYGTSALDVGEDYVEYGIENVDDVVEDGASAVSGSGSGGGFFEDWSLDVSNFGEEGGFMGEVDEILYDSGESIYEGGEFVVEGLDESFLEEGPEEAWAWIDDNVIGGAESLLSGSGDGSSSSGSSSGSSGSSGSGSGRELQNKLELLRQVKDKLSGELSDAKREQLQRKKRQLQKRINQLRGNQSSGGSSGGGGISTTMQVSLVAGALGFLMFVIPEDEGKNNG